MTLLHRGGLENMSMRMIADQAGISLGNLQYHFKTRPEILEVLADRFLDDFFRDCHDNLQKIPEASLEDAFEKMLTLETGEQCAIVFKELWALSHRDETCREQLCRHYRKLHGLLLEWLANILPDNTDQSNVTAIVDLLIALLEGYCVTAPYLKPDARIQAKRLAGLTRQMIG